MRNLSPDEARKIGARGGLSTWSRHALRLEMRRAAEKSVADRRARRRADEEKTTSSAGRRARDWKENP